MLKKVGVGVAAILFLALLTFLALRLPAQDTAAPQIVAATETPTRVFPPVGPYVTPDYQACIKAAQAEVDESNCLGDELDRQNSALKTAFDKRAAYLGAGSQADMAKAQEAWEAFREADCDAQAIKGGAGSGAVQSWTTCMVRVTSARAAEMPTYGEW